MDNISIQLLDILEELTTKNLKKFQWYLTIGVEGSKSIPKAQLENADTCDTVDKMVEQYGSNRAVEITLAILKKMNHNQLAEELRTKHSQAAPSTAQPELGANIPALTQDAHKKAESEQLKSIFRSQYSTLYEGTAAKGRHMDFNEIYTELYVVKDWRGGISTDHEIIQIEAGTMRRDTTDIQISFSDVFGDRDGKKVLMLGIAGIGKTVCVQKFVVDWAEGRSNAEIDFVFLIPFRELNLLKDEQHSLHELLDYIYPDLKHLKETGIYDNKCRCIFIFDGLDEMRKQLNFGQKKVSDITKKTCVDVLITNLIIGALLPSASVWITSRPAAADQIHMKHIHLVTEVRGFVTDQQKEEYFRKRIGDQDKASRIISHIRQSKTLHIMCYIPVFCLITATVLQEMGNQCTEAPKSLSEMYAHFLIIQMCTKNEKFHETHQKDTKKLLESNRDMILKLAELAFKQLMKGNVMFYEEDLRECGIDVTDASVYSGICTEIFREESVLYQSKIYCFVHLSFQEFLAAFYVFHCFVNKNLVALQVFMVHDEYHFRRCYEGDLLIVSENSSEDSDYTESDEYRHQSENVPLHKLLKGAVDEALESQNGHLDLFLRFLLGISLESNQRLLQGLLTHKHSSLMSINKAVKYIKDLIQKKNLPTERSINLFLCLTEIDDQSLSREIQQYLKPEKRSEKWLSAAQCSAIAYMLQMTGEVLDELNLGKYNTSTEGKRRLIPAANHCRRALLAGCNFNRYCCETLCSAMKSENSPLTELDLHYSTFHNPGVMMLFDGLESLHSKLEILRLSDCSITETCCKSLTSALQKQNSLKELELNHNDLRDSGVEHLCVGLKTSHCKLEILRLSACNITEASCKSFTSALQKEISLKELVLNNNNLQDSGVKHLCAGLKSTHCKLEILRLSACNITEESCISLTSVLQKENSLKELELNDNDLRDSGVEHLCFGLKSSHCQLEILRLDGCLVTEKGYSSLASALSSNPTHLKELDLVYNYPGDSGMKLLSAIVEDAHYKLNTLRVDQVGTVHHTLGPRRNKYNLTLDPNTANTRLSLSEENKKVKFGREHCKYPDHLDRFDDCPQVLCRGFTGIARMGPYYWEAECSVWSVVAMAYNGISRKGSNTDSWFGCNEKSWCLICCEDSYIARHNNKATFIPAHTSSSKKVGVYVDGPSGTLSFYSVSSDTHTMTRLHTFYSTFTEAPCPGVGFLDGHPDTTVCLC